MTYAAAWQQAEDRPRRGHRLRHVALLQRQHRRGRSSRSRSSSRPIPELPAGVVQPRQLPRAPGAHRRPGERQACGGQGRHGGGRGGLHQGRRHRSRPRTSARGGRRASSSCQVSESRAAGGGRRGARRAPAASCLWSVFGRSRSSSCFAGRESRRRWANRRRQPGRRVSRRPSGETGGEHRWRRRRQLDGGAAAPAIGRRRAPARAPAPRLHLGRLADPRAVLIGASFYVAPLRAFFAQQDRYQHEAAALQAARADNAAYKVQVELLSTKDYVAQRARADSMLVPPDTQVFVIKGLPGRRRPVAPVVGARRRRPGRSPCSTASTTCGARCCTDAVSAAPAGAGRSRRAVWSAAPTSCAVAAQLARRPHAMSRVVARCPFGYPAAVEDLPYGRRRPPVPDAVLPHVPDAGGRRLRA